MKKWIFFLMCCLLLSGCGSYREVNDMVIVSGGGVEQSTAGQFSLVCQLVTLPDGKSTPQTDITEVSAKTPSAAFDAVSTLTGKDAYWSHCQTFLLGENLSKQGVSQVIDSLLADPEIRLTDRLIVTVGTTPKAALKSSAAAGEISGFDLYNLVSSDSSDLNMPLYRFTNTLSETGIDPILPAVTIEKTGFPSLYGTAIFRGDHLVGYLNPDQTITFLLLKGHTREMSMTTSDGHTYTIDSSLCRISPAKTEEGLVFTVHLNIKTRPETTEDTEGILKKDLEGRIADLTQILQKDLNADSLGLMRQAYRYLPYHYTDAEKDALYQQAKIRTEITVSLTKNEEVKAHA